MACLSLEDSKQEAVGARRRCSFRNSSGAAARVPATDGVPPRRESGPPHRLHWPLSLIRKPSGGVLDGMDPGFGSPQPGTTSGPNEHSPLTAAASGETVLVLSPHARTGRRMSILLSLLFMMGFHAALVFVGVMNWSMPCERPLAAYLFSTGAVGLFGAVLYFSLEVKRARDEASLLPTETMPPVARVDKLLVLASFGAATLITLAGASFYADSPSCSHTSPVVHSWALATLLLYASFGLLVGLVPVLSATLPFFAAALLPLIAILVAFANWLSEAGKRGAASAITVLRQWSRTGEEAAYADSEGGGGALQPPSASSPSSTFALYVNTSALVWVFGFMLVEVKRSWMLPCDVPLPGFVLGVALLGLLLTLAGFVGAVFKDQMPPVTKLEQARARDERRRKLYAYGWLMGALALWGALGVFWLKNSNTCGHTSPSLFRLSFLLGMVYFGVAGLVLLIGFALALDYCFSGKLRFVVILEE